MTISQAQSSRRAAPNVPDNADGVSSKIRSMSIIDSEGEEDDIVFLKTDRGKRKAVSHDDDKDDIPMRSSKKSRDGDTSRHLHSSSSNQKLTWIKDDRPLPPKADVTYRLSGLDQRCTKEFRSGCMWRGVEYRVHDAVNIRFNEESPAQSPVLIRSFFTLTPQDLTGRPRHYAHVHHLTLRSATLQGTGRNGELFLRNMQCQDVPLQKLLAGQKLNFELVGGNMGRQRGQTDYFCQYVDRPSECAVEEPIHDALLPCDSCHHRRQRARYGDIRLHHSTVLSIGKEKYHLDEFILIDPQVPGATHIVGQVRRWVQGQKGVEVEVGLFKRSDDAIGPSAPGFISNRLLAITDVTERFSVRRIMGRAFVHPTEHDCRKNDSSSGFWCDVSLRPGLIPLQKPLRSCRPCLDVETDRIKDLQECLGVSQLPAVDYYSGAGGFLLPGLDIFDWRSAVDIDDAACQTLRQLRGRSPRLRVHQGTVSELYNRTTDPRVPSNGPNVLPKPGSIFLLTCGPPCQGHSRANHQTNKASLGPSASLASSRDIRNDELFVMIAEIIRLRPYVVIIENVAAFKDEKHDSSEEVADGNYARRAMRELAQHGYSSRLGLIDSRSYGSPQNRVRCFILAVRSGLPLPDFPNPTHANPRVIATIFRDEQGGADPFYLGERRGTRGTGTLPAVTIHDAISDLPVFDCHPPGVHNGNRRRARPTFPGGRNPTLGNNTKVGYAYAAPYASGPQNEYQKSKRGDRELVQDHYTSYNTDGQLAIIFGASKGPTPRGCERRADPNEGFSTLLTSSAPGSKGTAVIHPCQDRKFTIAERKRAMGWPDWYRLAGTPLDQDRLTGNGVCFESVQAIYKAIVKEVVMPWWIRAGRPTDDVFQKFRSDHP